MATFNLNLPVNPDTDRKGSLFSLHSGDHQDEVSPVNARLMNLQPNFGLCFDIDGVLAIGTRPLDEAVMAFKLLSDANGQLRVPCCFVTNAAGCPKKKAVQLSSWFKINVDPAQVILAPTPLTVFRKWHDKRVVIVGQGDVIPIAKESVSLPSKISNIWGPMAIHN
ncbi:hypothetical protein Ciccas_014097 [Cichlidogyrus casuarinus]|uniref:Uncharacterized protein n=1 Tax=Cichlidogyrus casuarinus TaxID=1844966 RepID=A0ABD2PIY3_9PLAT